MLKHSSPKPFHIENVGIGHPATYQASTEQKFDGESFGVRLTTDPVAFFTMILAIATIGLWFFTAKLWRVTSQAVLDTASELVLTKDAFLAAHRAKLRIRAVVQTDDVGLHEGRPYVAGTDYRFRIIVVNVGDTEASLVSARHEADYGQAYFTPSFDYGLITELEGPVPPGGQVSIDFSVMSIPGSSFYEIDQKQVFFNTAYGPFVIVELRYRDSRGVLRKVSAHRRLNGVGRFEPIPYSDHEYED